MQIIFNTQTFIYLIVISLNSLLLPLIHFGLNPGLKLMPIFAHIVTSKTISISR